MTLKPVAEARREGGGAAAVNSGPAPWVDPERPTTGGSAGQGPSEHVPRLAVGSETRLSRPRVAEPTSAPSTPKAEERAPPERSLPWRRAGGTGDGPIMRLDTIASKNSGDAAASGAEPQQPSSASQGGASSQSGARPAHGADAHRSSTSPTHERGGQDSPTPQYRGLSASDPRIIYVPRGGALPRIGEGPSLSYHPPGGLVFNRELAQQTRHEVQSDNVRVQPRRSQPFGGHRNTAALGAFPRMPALSP